MKCEEGGYRMSDLLVLEMLAVSSYSRSQINKKVKRVLQLIVIKIKSNSENLPV